VTTSPDEVVGSPSAPNRLGTRSGVEAAEVARPQAQPRMVADHFPGCRSHRSTGTPAAPRPAALSNVTGRHPSSPMRGRGKGQAASTGLYWRRNPPSNGGRDSHPEAQPPNAATVAPSKGATRRAAHPAKSQSATPQPAQAPASQHPPAAAAEQQGQLAGEAAGLAKRGRDARRTPGPHSAWYTAMSGPG